MPRRGQHDEIGTRADNLIDRKAKPSANLRLVCDLRRITRVSLDADNTATFVSVLDIKAKTFGPAVLLANGSGLTVKKTDKGFAFDDYREHGEVDSLASGIGPAAGLDMVVQQNDLWKSAEIPGN